MTKTQNATKKLINAIYDNYFGMGNIFEIGCITKKDNEIIVYNKELLFINDNTLAKKESDFIYKYKSTDDLLKDLLLYFHKELFCFDYDDISNLDEALEKLNDNNVVYLQFNMDFFEVKLFNTIEDVKDYLNEYCDFDLDLN